MHRRTFLRTGLSVAGSSLALYGQTRELIRPRALKAGDTVGIVAPSTSVFDPDLLATAEQNVRSLGLNPVFGKYVRQRSDYETSIRQRVEDLERMFRDRDIAGVFALRGGYGAMQILDRVNYDLIRSNPKVFLGYSDITALHLAIQKMAGLVTFHGPVALSEFTSYTRSYLRKAIFDTTPIGLVTNPGDQDAARSSLRTVRRGSARGRLIGGNLTLICSTLGTPYEIDTRDRLLFIEDVGEEPYRIDRMLTQLRLAGKLGAAAGVIFGQCAQCGPSDYKPSFSSIFTLGEIVDNLLGLIGVPVLSGLAFGHTADQLTVPEGVTATLDAGKKVLNIEEAGVIS